MKNVFIATLFLFTPLWVLSSRQALSAPSPCGHPSFISSLEKEDSATERVMDALIVSKTLAEGLENEVEIKAEIEAEMAQRQLIATEDDQNLSLAGIGCFDLSSLSWLAVAREKQAEITDEVIPYEFYISSLTPAAIPGGIVRGRVEIKNVSQYTTMKTGSARISTPNGSSWSPFIQVELAPGQTHSEEIFFDADPGSRSVNGPFRAAYNPDVERDYEGIGQLFQDMDFSFDYARPYPSYEFTICLVDDRRCPSMMWSSTQNPCFKKTPNGHSPKFSHPYCGGSGGGGTASSGGSSSSDSGSDGPCNNPNDIAADGKRCGGRAASEKPGGR